VRRRRVPALLVAALGGGLAAAAAGASGPPASAILVRAEAGDRACYLTLRDARGTDSQAFADFGVCDAAQGLAGRRVELTWDSLRIPAADCGGDPECPRSETVRAVVRAAPAAGAALRPGSLCRTTETVVFACDAGARRVSVCAAPGAGGGTVQYRYGRPGAAPDLSLPAAPGRPASSSSGDTLMFSGGGGAWLRFVNGAYSYTVFSAIGRWGPGGAPAEKAGVLVEKSGVRVSHVRCTGGDTGVDAGWMEAVGVRPDARGFDLP